MRAAEPRPDAALQLRGEGDRLVLSGRLAITALPSPDAFRGAKQVDLSGLTGLDTAGAWLLDDARRNGAELVGLPAGLRPVLDAVAAAVPAPPPTPPRRGLRNLVEDLGRKVVVSASGAAGLVEYLGRFLAALGRALRHPAQFPFTALVHHCQQAGLAAVPIVATISALIGVVLAYQGAFQLRAFGAEIFTVDLIGIAVLREMGILLTAIVVAGRTGAAFTAAIGAMRMREEIDAMRTLDIDPDMALMLPRVLALVLMMPILALIADLAGLLGGAVMSWGALGISPAMFMARLGDRIAVTHAVVGLIKAPIFGLLIGVIGCRAGMQVGGDTESLGRLTSASVVAAIFAVILADAAFSIFFAQVGW